MRGLLRALHGARHLGAARRAGHARDAVEWLSSLGSMLACEQGCTALGLIAGPEGWPMPHQGPVPADVPAAVEDAVRRMGGAR